MNKMWWRNIRQPTLKQRYLKHKRALQQPHMMCHTRHLSDYVNTTVPPRALIGQLKYHTFVVSCYTFSSHFKKLLPQPRKSVAFYMQHTNRLHVKLRYPSQLSFCLHLSGHIARNEASIPEIVFLCHTFLPFIELSSACTICNILQYQFVYNFLRLSGQFIQNMQKIVSMRKTSRKDVTLRHSRRFKI